MPFIVAPSSDAAADSDDERFRQHVSPFIRSDCSACHDSSKKARGLDLSVYGDPDAVAADLERWDPGLEQLEQKAMPPVKARVQPDDDERRRVIDRIRAVRNWYRTGTRRRSPASPPVDRVGAGRASPRRNRREVRSSDPLGRASGIQGSAPGPGPTSARTATMGSPPGRRSRAHATRAPTAGAAMESVPAGPSIGHDAYRTGIHARDHGVTSEIRLDRVAAAPGL